MKLVIHNTDKLLDINFCYWLIPRIRTSIITSVSLPKLVKLDDWINTKYLTSSNNVISCARLIQFGANNLITYESGDDFIVTINPNIYTPNLDQVKLISILKLINFGNSQVSGSYIFTDVFNRVANDINKHIDAYIDLGI